MTGERTQEGFYRVKNGLEQAISRGVAYAPYADLVWCETGVPDIGFAREFAQAVHAACPGKLLSYNCSPSFNWKKNLNDKQIASFQEDLSALWATSTSSSRWLASTSTGTTLSSSPMHTPTAKA